MLNNIILNNWYPRQNYKLFIATQKTCHYMKLKPMEIKNATTSTAFFKKGEYFKNKKFLLNLSDLFFVFFRIESILSKTFLKNTISILNIYLNPFVSNVPFLSPPNLTVLWCFLGVEKGCNGNKWVNHLKYVLDK